MYWKMLRCKIPDISEGYLWPEDLQVAVIFLSSVFSIVGTEAFIIRKKWIILESNYSYFNSEMQL